jgi:arginine/lysine/ornithine decarboxylase
MPGHKGRLPAPWEGAAVWDITEVDGTDSLYEASGAIAEAEAAYTVIYGSKGSFLSAGGSTLCIQAMLALATKPGDTVICGRGIHTAAVNAMALLDLTPAWVYPAAGTDGLMGAIEPVAIETVLDAHPEAVAVYLTSPNYYGVLCDVAAIAAICHRRGVPLLVDNAHGAYLKFLPQSLHPMEGGADMCADSLHKTLPVLTGGAMLHVGNPAYLRDAKRKMALFGSTSPSYLILLSCDRALAYLNGSVREDLLRVTGELERLRALAEKRGYRFPSGRTSPLHFAVVFGDVGYLREDYGRAIRAQGVEPEYLGERVCVFLASPTTSREELAALERVITTLPRRAPAPLQEESPLPYPSRVMTLREAAFAATESLPVEEAIGRIASAMVAPCPPGIPLLVPGEKLSREMAACLKRTGIIRINVVR